MGAVQFTSRSIGFPRIGPKRELKKALELRWADKIDQIGFNALRSQLIDTLREDQSSLDEFTDDNFLYDAVLETAMMFGFIPDWAKGSDEFSSLSNLTRGSEYGHDAWEMTKWFDTNYHYVVPEIDSLAQDFIELPWRRRKGTVLSLIGPYSLVKLSKTSNISDTLLMESIVDSLVAYLSAWSWTEGVIKIQLDEPCLGLMMDEQDVFQFRVTYDKFRSLLEAVDNVEISVTVQFGNVTASDYRFLGLLGMVTQIDVKYLHMYEDAWEAQPGFLISVLDGRSVWPGHWVNDDLLEIDFMGKDVALCPSTSLMFVPYSVEVEDEELQEFSFAKQKVEELVHLVDKANEGVVEDSVVVESHEWPALPTKVPTRVYRDLRKKNQEYLNLPSLPITTIGSLPQTDDLRKLRAAYNSGDISSIEYFEDIHQRVDEAIDWQEQHGLDVFVHGEFERTDMVEYFAEKMDGYFTTKRGWVLSYGSRCVRPPILYRPPTIYKPMTVDEWDYAQGYANKYDKPVKGMLTGPVTIVNWSFRPPGVSDDLLFWAVAQPIGEEIGWLIDEGAVIIQVDEPAVRERWPLETWGHENRRSVYSLGAMVAIDYVFNVPPEIQMHTHMCYGDFLDIVHIWATAGVDVASIEFARSDDISYIEAFAKLDWEIGPGLFDAHSPYSPGEDKMMETIQRALGVIDLNELWINPDCGLKTRSWSDIDLQIKDMVEATEKYRNAV